MARVQITTRQGPSRAMRKRASTQPTATMSHSSRVILASLVPAIHRMRARPYCGGAGDPGPRQDSGVESGWPEREENLLCPLLCPPRPFSFSVCAAPAEFRSHRKCLILAEGERFELSDELPRRRFSRPLP